MIFYFQIVIASHNGYNFYDAKYYKHRKNSFSIVFLWDRTVVWYVAVKGDGFMKRFNIAANCVPEMHYMVDISDKIKGIEEMIAAGEYFTINRARQYGKTTTMFMLEKRLKDNYTIINTTFEGQNSLFENEKSFCSNIFDVFAASFRISDKTMHKKLKEIGKGIESYADLSEAITGLVENNGKEVVLLIDEVDKAANNAVFLDFLGVLRAKYINRSAGKDITFKSVILAGVHDIKNLKLHIKERRVLTREEAMGIDSTMYNSPWNVAVDFKIDMSFNSAEISTMLRDYIQETGVKMNLEFIAEEIHNYTSGYPFLVSKLCKTIEEELNRNWSIDGIQEAVTLILKEKNTLFDSLIKNLENNRELYNTVYRIVIEGKKFDYNLYAYEPGIMYGILAENRQGKLSIHNRIFELLIYNYMISRREIEKDQLLTYEYRTDFIDSRGDLDIKTILEKFQELMKAEYREKDKGFIEREGRLIFLAFVKPIINGKGFYFVEPQTRQDNRMGVVITYNKKKYIIELKLWNGKEYESKGMNQLAGYLDSQNEPKGYMIIFNFNKNKEYTKKWLDMDGKAIYEVIV